MSPRTVATSGGLRARGWSTGGGPARRRPCLLRTGPLTAPVVRAVWPRPASPTRQLRGDAARAWPVDQLDPVGIGPLRCPGRLHGHDRDPVNAELGLGPHDVARPSTAGKERAVQGPSRVESARGPPCPGPVGPRARELDLDTACHRTKVQLRSVSANHSSYAKAGLLFCHSDETAGLRLVWAANRATTRCR
jgi:hypothetical protein